MFDFNSWANRWVGGGGVGGGISTVKRYGEISDHGKCSRCTFLLDWFIGNCLPRKFILFSVW